MTPTKLLLGQILIVFAIMLAGLWASTQWIAAQSALSAAAWRAMGNRLWSPAIRYRGRFSPGGIT